MWITIIVVSFVIREGSAGLAHAVAQVHPKYPGRCFWEATNTTYDVGETWDPETSTNSCTAATCILHRMSAYIIELTLVIRFESCPPVLGPCQSVGDWRLDFPDCCPQPYCLQDLKSSHNVTQNKENDVSKEDIAFNLTNEAKHKTSRKGEETKEKEDKEEKEKEEDSTAKTSTVKVAETKDTEGETKGKRSQKKIQVDENNYFKGMKADGNKTRGAGKQEDRN